MGVATSKGPAARGEKRRVEILKTALALFNARGTAEVSTNHIAAELGISVGNLYWHFSDKEAIVRALYEDHVERFDEMWQPLASADYAARTVVEALRRTFTISWECRFFYRGPGALLRVDPALRKLYAVQRDRRRGELRAFQKGLAELGLLRLPDDEASLAQLEDLAWMVAVFWLPHVELRDGVLTKQGALTGARAVLGLYLPYSTKEFSRALSRALEQADEE